MSENNGIEGFLKKFLTESAGSREDHHLMRQVFDQATCASLRPSKLPSSLGHFQRVLQERAQKLSCTIKSELTRKSKQFLAPFLTNSNSSGGQRFCYDLYSPTHNKFNETIQSTLKNRRRKDYYGNISWLMVLAEMENTIPRHVENCQNVDYTDPEDRWLDDVAALFSIAFYISEPERLQEILVNFHRHLRGSVFEAVPSKDIGRLVKLQTHVYQNMYTAKTIHDNLSCDERKLIQTRYAETVTSILGLLFDIVVTVDGSCTDTLELGGIFKAFAVNQLGSYQVFLWDLLLPCSIPILDPLNQVTSSHTRQVAKEVLILLASHVLALPMPPGVKELPDVYAKFMAVIHHVKRLYPDMRANAIQDAYEIKAPETFRSWVRFSNGSERILEQLEFHHSNITNFLLAKVDKFFIANLLDVIEWDMFQKRTASTEVVEEHGVSHFPTTPELEARYRRLPPDECPKIIIPMNYIKEESIGSEEVIEMFDSPPKETPPRKTPQELMQTDSDRAVSRTPGTPRQVLTHKVPSRKLDISSQPVEHPGYVKTAKSGSTILARPLELSKQAVGCIMDAKSESPSSTRSPQQACIFRVLKAIEGNTPCQTSYLHTPSLGKENYSSEELLDIVSTPDGVEKEIAEVIDLTEDSAEDTVKAAEAKTMKKRKRRAPLQSAPVVESQNAAKEISHKTRILANIKASQKLKNSELSQSEDTAGDEPNPKRKRTHSPRAPRFVDSDSSSERSTSFFTSSTRERRGTVLQSDSSDNPSPARSQVSGPSVCSYRLEDLAFAMGIEIIDSPPKKKSQALMQTDSDRAVSRSLGILRQTDSDRAVSRSPGSSRQTDSDRAVSRSPGSLRQTYSDRAVSRSLGSLRQTDSDRAVSRSLGSSRQTMLTPKAASPKSSISSPSVESLGYVRTSSSGSTMLERLLR